MTKFLDFIDHIYFINLDHRYDRACDFYRMMQNIEVPEEKITRISAIFEPMNGALGCTKSHIKAIELFLESNHQRCCILEDDFDFYSKGNLEDFCSKIQTLNPEEWDLLLFSGVVSKSDPTPYSFLKRVYDLQTSSSYVLTRRYAPILLENMKEGSEALDIYFRGSGRIIPEYCLDIYWKSLQKKDIWFVSNPILGFQRPSYSDIQKKNVDYTLLEMNLNIENNERA